MTRKRGQSAFTLTEMLIVMAILAITFGLGLQATKMIVASFESGANVRHIISAGLANARALAMKEGTYVGVRFQPNREGRQYMVLIRHDYEAIGLANGFVAVDSRQPTPLPKNVLVLDTQVYAGSISSDANLDEARELTDAKTFSVVFDKSGRLVTHEVRVMVRDVRYIPPPTEPPADYDMSSDDIFNTIDNVTNNLVGRFIQDGVNDYRYNDTRYVEMGLGEEPSRNCFYVVQRSAFEAVDPTSRWSTFLKAQTVRYVNPFSGEIVNQEVRP